MFQVKLQTLANPLELKLDLFDEINRIPLEITLGAGIPLHETVLHENLDEGNFSEFRFHSATGKLFTITIVSIQEKDVINSSELNSLDNAFTSAEYYAVTNLALERKRTFLKTFVQRNNNSICFSYGESDLKNISFFKVNDIFALGIKEHSLCAFFLRDLSPKAITDIFGF